MNQNLAGIIFGRSSEKIPYFDPIWNMVIIFDWFFISIWSNIYIVHSRNIQVSQIKGKISYKFPGPFEYFIYFFSWRQILRKNVIRIHSHISIETWMWCIIVPDTASSFHSNQKFNMASDKGRNSSFPK